MTSNEIEWTLDQSGEQCHAPLQRRQASAQCEVLQDGHLKRSERSRRSQGAAMGAHEPQELKRNVMGKREMTSFEDKTRTRKEKNS